MLFGNEAILFGEFVLQIFQDRVVQITGSSADHTNQMVVVLTTVFALELFDAITKIDLGPHAVVFNDLDGLVDIRFAPMVLV